MTETALAFTEQLDRIGELGMVLLLGAMLSRHYLWWTRSGSCRSSCW